MTRVGLLLQEQIRSSLPPAFRKKGGKSNLAGTLLTLILVAGILAVFVILFSRFVGTYLGVRINRIADVPSRQFELMSMAYFVLFVVCIAVGVSGFCRSLFEDTNLVIIVTMPFSATQIFVSHLINVYLRQLLITAFFVLPVNFTFLATAGIVSAYNVLMTFVVTLVLPFLSLGVASILVLPYYALKRLVSTSAVATACCIVGVMGGFGFLYSRVFEVVCALLDSGKITTLFNQETMNGIVKFSSHAYPANFIADLMLGRNVGLSIGVVVGASVVLFGLGTVLVRLIFNKVVKADLTFAKPRRGRGHEIMARSPFGTLLHKEFTMVLRNSDYTYMYFATALVMPLMVYYTSRMGNILTTSLLGKMPVGFAVCTFVTMLYSTLTNTFCSTNISRDGYMALTVKTLPFRPETVLGAKMVFCLIVSTLSIIASVVVTAAVGFQTWGEAAMSFAACLLLAVAQILFATKLDLKYPHFSNTPDGNIKEANSTVSVVILVGLVASFGIGGLLLLQAIAAEQQQVLAAFGKIPRAVLAIVIPAVLAGLAATYFFVRLPKRYAALNAEV